MHFADFQKDPFFQFSFSGQAQSGRIYEAVGVIRKVDASLSKCTGFALQENERLQDHMGHSWQEPR